MKSVPVWVYYSVLRVLMFAVPFGLLMAMQIKFWIAALVAALIGFCLSYIFLRTPRESMSRDLYEARHRDKAPVAADDASEDEAVDRASRLDETVETEQNAPSAASERERRSE